MSTDGRLVINDFVSICTQADVMHMKDKELGPPSVCMVYEIAVPIAIVMFMYRNISAACKGGI